MSEVLSLSQVNALPDQLLRSVPAAQAGGHRPDRSTLAVRSFPFPFRAGLAVSNDCDSQSTDCLDDWHAFVNGSRPTRYGDGLKLEVGDSFWVYGGALEPALFKGHPWDENHPDGYALGKIVELGRLGWLDTLHSFGNWSVRYLTPDNAAHIHPHARPQIEKGLARLDELGIKPFVYVNHSGSVSNVGGPWGWYQKADDPEHPLYCLDLLKAFGFRYFWLDSCTQLDKFGEELDFEDDWAFRRELDRFRWAHWFRRVDENRVAHPVAMPESDDARRDYLLGMFNRLILPVPANDGSRLLAFKRYRDIDQPVGATFSAQVTAAKLDRLEAARGAVIVYQHFGVFGPRGRSPTLSRPHRKRSPIPSLDEHNVATWQLIAERNRAGQLFVATVGRLLEWVWLRDALRFRLDRREDMWVVNLLGFECPVRGRGALERQHLNGLAFTVPSDAPEVLVHLEGDDRPLPMQRKPDPVHAGTDAVYLPWQALEWPE